MGLRKLMLLRAKHAGPVSETKYPTYTYQR